MNYQQVPGLDRQKPFGAKYCTERQDAPLTKSTGVEIRLYDAHASIHDTLN